MTNSKAKVPAWFWIVSIVALVWNSLGVMNYLGMVFITPEAFAHLPQNQQDYYAAIPSWATAGFAFAVWGGALGSLLLVFRKSLAHTVLVVSFVGILVQMSHALFISNSYDVFGPGGLAMTLSIIVVGLLLVLFARSARTKDWIS